MSILWRELTQEQRSILLDAFEQDCTISLSLPRYNAALGLVKIGLGFSSKADSWHSDGGYFRINERGRRVVDKEAI